MLTQSLRESLYKSTHSRCRGAKLSSFCWSTDNVLYRDWNTCAIRTIGCQFADVSIWKIVWSMKLEENRAVTALSNMKGNWLNMEMMGYLLSLLQLHSSNHLSKLII